MKTLFSVFTIALTLIAAASCNNVSQKKTDVTDTNSNNASIPTLSDVKDQQTYEEYAASLASAHNNLMFENFTLTLPITIYNTEIYQNIIQSDTVYLYLELGETIEGQLMQLTTDKLINVQLEQRYETSVTIMNEGPHCDLTEWIHYNSEWIPLNKNNEGEYIGCNYEEDDRRKFPEITLEELKEEVKIQCGEDWVELIKDIQTLIEYPCDINISRYFLKITGTLPDNQEAVSKLIILETPMGC